MPATLLQAFVSGVYSFVSRHRWMLTGLSVSVLVCVLGICAYSMWRTAQPDEVILIATERDGKTMTVDAFWPAEVDASDRCSAIILLPGVEGAKYGASMHYSRARQLAAEGHAVFVVHYLEPCGYEHLYYQRDDGSLDTDAIDAVIRSDSMYWIADITAAIDAILNRPEIDGDRIGLLGYSLGCFVSISVADRVNKDRASPNIAALVGNWGARFEGVDFDASFPRCRFCHGRLDKIVPVAWAEQTVGELKAAGVDTHLSVFEGEGHVVTDPQAWQLTMTFFQSLRSERTAATASLAN